MNILDIYDHYFIMPNLQMHMLRVAGVAKILLEHATEPVETENIIQTCLLHDMGNILKFDLLKFPDFLEPQGLEYWQKVKDDFARKYGPDEHQASLQIVKEIGVSERVIELIDSISFLKTKSNLESKDLTKMICAYSDDRVDPRGVVSLEGRIIDLEKRYGPRYPSEEDKERRRIFATQARLVEQYIFEHSTTLPEEIGDQSVEKYFDQLKKTEFSE
jgi:hypothetical protein